MTMFKTKNWFLHENVDLERAKKAVLWGGRILNDDTTPYKEEKKEVVKKEVTNKIIKRSFTSKKK